MTCENCPDINERLCCHQAMRPIRRPLARSTDFSPAAQRNVEQDKAEWGKKYDPSIFEELERRGEL